MISERMKKMIGSGSAIRAMFEEGKRLAALYGEENVYDFSLGNPNFPAPDAVNDAIRAVLAEERSSFPVGATVACQGVEGAFSGVAAKKLFEITDITYFKTFEGVFNAVEKGLCDYGVLPIENSSAGSVLPVYDLMKKHNFYIVKSIRVPVRHSLVAKDPKVKITKV